MKISSLETERWVSIEDNGDGSFTVQTHIDIGHGRFDAINTKVSWLNYTEFVSVFNKFVFDRNLTPRLEGTYETYIAFRGRGHCIILNYRLGDAYGGGELPEYHYQSGTFEVSQEHLLQILEEFRRPELDHPEIS